MRIRICAALAAFALLSSGALAAEESMAKIVDQVAKLHARINGYQAVLEVHDSSQEEDVAATSTIKVSKQRGWKIINYTPEGNIEVINDFRTSYQWIPQEKKVLKYVADIPETAEAFRKPAMEMNLLAVLDPATLKSLGTEQLRGETVYHIEGTTTTQFMEEGKPVSRKIEAWISTKDGLPRKTIEYAEETTGTTLYRDVVVNPPFAPGEFQFTPPKDAEIIDLNAEMRKAREEATPPAKKK